MTFSSPFTGGLLKEGNYRCGMLAKVGPGKAEYQKNGGNPPLRALFSSEKSGGDVFGDEGHFALFIHDLVRFAQAGPAIGGLAQRGVARLRIARTMACHAAQVAFADGVADADVHAR